jgi:hypothetical protein
MCKEWVHLFRYDHHLACSGGHLLLADLYDSLSLQHLHQGIGGYGMGADPLALIKDDFPISPTILGKEN